MSRPQVLLVNPPIYDFTAFDYWLRPYGMFRVAGRIAGSCDLTFFDFLEVARRDPWGRGRYRREPVERPAALCDVPRNFGRFGAPRESLRQLLSSRKFDAVLVQTSMTYWYPGVAEVIDSIRAVQPGVPIVLGGVYATVCTAHALSLGPDLVVVGSDLRPLWPLLGHEPSDGLPCWPEPDGGAGVLKLTDGCPFRCSYCATPVWGEGFSARPAAVCVSELRRLLAMGYRQVAFYDDALLHEPERALIPFLREVICGRIKVHFHTPNALNARLLTGELAELMTQAGVRSFFFGLESSASGWQRATGDKVRPGEFVDAVRRLQRLGVRAIGAYVIVGHPDVERQGLDDTFRVAHESGARIMLSEFSPVPGTRDAERCRRWADLDEPLHHNKTAFATRFFGREELDRLKDRVRALNARLPAHAW